MNRFLHLFWPEKEFEILSPCQPQEINDALQSAKSTQFSMFASVDRKTTEEKSFVGTYESGGFRLYQNRRPFTNLLRSYTAIVGEFHPIENGTRVKIKMRGSSLFSIILCVAFL